MADTPNLASKTSVMKNISFMWRNDFEKQEWTHVLEQLDERGINFVNSVLYDRAETKVKLRHFIDPNFYFGAADCFVWPYNHNPDLQEFKNTLQRNIIALKSTIKRIEETKKRRPSVSATKPSSPPKKSKSSHHSEDPTLAQAHTSKQPTKPVAADKNQTTVPRKSSQPSPCKPPLKTQIETLDHPIRKKNSKTVTTPKKTPNKQSINPSINQSINPSNLKSAKTIVQLNKDQPTTSKPEAEMEADSNESEDEASQKKKDTLSPIHARSPSPILDIHPLTILTKMVKADRNKEQMTEDELRYIKDSEFTSDDLNDIYMSIMQALFEKDLVIASNYKKRLYNVKRYLKNKAIEGKGAKYLDALQEVNIKRYFRCMMQVSSTSTSINFCNHITRNEKDIKKHIREDHNETSKHIWRSYAATLLYAKEATDYLNIREHRQLQSFKATSPNENK